jgi:hypothetical protein
VFTRNDHGEGEPVARQARVRPTATEGKRYASKFRDLPARQAICRAVGHQWCLNDIIFGKELPRGMQAVPMADGSRRLSDTCKRCGKVRSISTFPGGIFDEDAPFSYKDPPGWVTLDEDYRVSPRQLLKAIIDSADLP